MDDVPAGPASPEPRRPSLSVVIPVHNGGRDLECCLRRLRDSDTGPIDYELIVVDDGSTDGSAERAASYGARVVRHDRPRGPAMARNTGALAATAPLIFFLDADVAVHREALGRVVARFEADPELAALFGSYDDAPTAPGLVSQFRNLLHHFVHQEGQFVADARPARTFWTGCGAIRRQVFLDFGGFDPRLYRRPAIEDIELGYRLTRAGCRILLVRNIQATHLKRWTLRGVIRTDIFRRGVPWMILMKRSGVAEADLNVKRGQRVCVAAAGLVGLALLASPLFPWLLLAVPAGLATQVGLNAAFYLFLARRRGWGFAVGSIPLHYLYYCCCGVSVLIALTLWRLSNRRTSAPETEPDPPAAPEVAAPSGVRPDPAAPVALGSRPHSPRAGRPSRWTRP
jgi:glycosyltransferase involved in cell wall biosynthesis